LVSGILVKIVLGLGNPGKKYERTRHNLGFMIVDRIAAQKNISICTKKCRSLVGEWTLLGEKVLLAKPQTFMNLSGEAVEELVRAFSLGIDDLLVVHDDMDLSFGRIRIRTRGGSAGHRGLQSILSALGSENFLRVRVGVGHPPVGVDPIDYLLFPFSEEEAALLDPTLQRAAEAVKSILEEGVSRAMERFNRSQPGETSS
jgi:PTH1 family peptidyl-tRNA hydrolase